MKDTFRWYTGWIAKVRKLKGTFYFSIDKGVARATHLEKGEKLYAYSGYNGDRPVMLVYLDKKNMVGKVEND